MSADATIEQDAKALAGKLSPAEREELLVRCWMAHDARWYMAVVGEFGLEAGSRLNVVAAREAGRAEARRMMKALRLSPPATAREALVAQEAIGGVLVPGMVDYRATLTDERTVEMRIDRCFAFDQVSKAGVAQVYDCGIFARLGGWWDAFGINYEMRPALAFRGEDGMPLLISAKCTHLGCTVASEVNADGKILCPCHISWFDVKTGVPDPGSPAKAPLAHLDWVLIDPAGKVVARRAPDGSAAVEGAELAGASVYIAKRREEVV